MKAYVVAVDHVFLIGVPAAGLASLAALLIQRGKMISAKTASEAVP
jgi:hypothetical protein